MEDNMSGWYGNGQSPSSSSGSGLGGFFRGLSSLASASGSILGAVRGNGATQNNQAAAEAQRNQAAQAATQKTLLWGGLILAGLAIIGFILFRKS